MASLNWSTPAIHSMGMGTTRCPRSSFLFGELGMLKTASPEVVWLAEARKHIGLKEIKGGKHHPEIVQFVAALCAAGWYRWGRRPLGPVSEDFDL